MKTINRSILLLFFVLLCAPAAVVYSQNIENETIQTDDTAAKDKKSEKKKDKDKIEIDAKFFISLAIDLATILIILGLIYYPGNRKMDYIFTFLIFNIVIFLLTYVLNKVKISMGAAFGLFAVFSMLRYRTSGISMKDMTYLFIFIAIGLLSAVQLQYYEMAILNGIVILGTFLLDGNIIIKRELCKNIQYENIELIKPENQTELIEDLRKRTGLNIHRISINRIDFLKDTARIRVYYYDKKK
jgi:hypothetical protein